MEPVIVKQDDKEEFYTRERCFIKEILNNDRYPDLSYAIARVEPGKTTVLHSLKDTSERYLVISGHGTVEAGDLPPARIDQGDLVLIPPNTPQRITNDGITDLVFYCLCTPRFKPSCYVGLETVED